MSRLVPSLSILAHLAGKVKVLLQAQRGQLWKLRANYAQRVTSVKALISRKQLVWRAISALQAPNLPLNSPAQLLQKALQVRATLAIVVHVTLEISVRWEQVLAGHARQAPPATTSNLIDTVIFAQLVNTLMEALTFA
jgi:hypothetical protein